MADKQQAGDPGAGDDRNQVQDGIDPEDDVTSEISGLVAAAFADDGLITPEEIRITDARLASYIDPETDNPLPPGTLLNDRFEIVERVHSGGMGHVYKAVDHRRKSDGPDPVYVAIKMLRESLSDRDDLRLALQREATKAQFLSHPNIISIFDFDEYEGRFFLVMEWLEGESVNDLLRRTSGQRLSPAFAWTVIEGAATAIRHAHLHDVVHADINPSNIFITTTQDVKLLDFGVARYANELRDPAEDAVAWVTQTYASPEVLEGQAPVFKDDVFALGCVAYRLLGGKHPFGGTTSIVARRGSLAIDPIPGLPERDWRILEQALAYSRSARPETVAVFLRNRESAASDGAQRNAALLRWALPVVAAIVAALAVNFWPRSEAPVTPATPVVVQDDANAVVDPGSAQVEPRADTSAIGALLVAAGQAVADQRLVQPEGDNARQHYRDVLALDPENPEALRGLRSISDAFVERADLALRENDPGRAESALRVARQTDAGNPAIGIVAELSVAQGDAQLAAARAQAASGDVEAAAATLALAEQYAHIDPASIRDIRAQLDALARDGALLESLAVADRHIAAGRLVVPAGNNALDVLASVSETYAGDPRLLAANERLVQRLLTSAALAVTSGNLAEAESLIDAADSLGVLQADVALAREPLAAAARTQAQPVETAPIETAQTETAAAEPVAIETAAIGSELTGNGLADAEATGTAAIVTESTAARSAADDEVEDAGAETDAAAASVVEGEAALAAGSEPAAVPEPVEQVLAAAPAAVDPGRTRPAPATDGSDVAAETVPGPLPITRSLDDLGLERFIAPNYPRGARRRGVTGFVDIVFDVNPDGRTSDIEVVRGVPDDVFDESAVNAVRKWRFESQEETVRAGVTLRFEVAD